MARVHTVFDCGHDMDVDVDVDDGVRIPESVRGLGKCPDCSGKTNLIPVSGIAPGAGGKDVELDTILMLEIG